jgi:hypothetical protein
MILIVVTVLPGSRIRDLSLLVVLDGRDMLLECLLLLLLCMLGLVLEGLLVDYSLFMLELEPLLQMR